MKKFLYGALMVLVAAVLTVPVMAADDDDMDFDFETEGQVRTRTDYWDNSVDFDDDNDDSYDWWPYRADIGLRGSFTENVWAFVELQAFGYFGDGDGGRQGYPGPSDGNIDLYQAYAVWDLGSWKLTAGRAEHELGNELHMGNDSFYNGLVFDGIRATREADNWMLDLFVYKHFEGQSPFSTSDDDANFLGATANFGLSKSTIEPYLLYYRDDSDGTSASFFPRVDIYTVGALWNRPTQDGKGWDANVEFAIQSGDIGEGAGVNDQLDAEGMILASWFGWTFGGGGRVHLGYPMASGDDDGGDDSFEGWYNLFDDGHAYNRLGNLDLFNSSIVNGVSVMTNVEDISAGYSWIPSEESKHAFYAALHNFTFAETTGDDDIGTEFDVTYNYTISHNAQAQIGAGYLASGDALGADSDDVTRVWAQFEFSWGKAKPWTSIGQSTGWNN